MKKKLLSVLMTVAMVAVLVTGCGSSSEEDSTAAVEETEEVAVEEEETEEVAEEAVGEAVSDETFAALQENYVTLVDSYEAVAEFYNQDEVEADANIESTMANAADVISQMGEITQESITEEDAESLNSAMMDILDALQMIVDAM